MFYKIVRFIVLVLLNLVFRIKIHSKDDRKNHNEPLIICSNHVTMFDPFLVAITFKDNLRYMAKKELFDNKILSFLLPKVGVFPVDRSGNSLTAIKNSIKILKENQTLGIFPEGTRIKKYDENSVKGGIGMLAVKSKASILPVYIEPGFKPFGRLNIYYGERYSCHNDKEKFHSDDYMEISKDIMNRIYHLKETFESDERGADRGDN